MNHEFNERHVEKENAGWHKAGGVSLILLGGLFPFAFVAAALFGFNASVIWPSALVFTGIGIIFYRRNSP